jgi:4-oxalocrotonate tautomerase
MAARAPVTELLVEEIIMPFVSIQLTREGTEPGVDHVTPEQKAAIYQGVSQVLFDVLKKPP